jgi:glycosyltransferase EpsD
MPVTKKVLFSSHTANFSKFNRPLMRWFKAQGYEVHYASAGEETVRDCDVHFTVPFERSPFKFGNILAYRQLKKIINSQDYAIIHTHTPMGSVVTRLAAKAARKKGTRVLYTAHGFHFYAGAPLLNWLLYYPIEKWMSRHTDTLVTINNEDYERAKNSLHATTTHHIDGVGVDIDQFAPVTARKKQQLRKVYGLSNDDVVLIYAAELNANKNQGFLIAQMNAIVREIPTAKLLLCGTGSHAAHYARMIKQNGLEDVVLLMGYRRDMSQLFALSDMCVASSLREGQGLGLVEAMATGLPIIASNNRGHRAVIKDGTNGFLYPAYDGLVFQSRVVALHRDRVMARRMSQQNNADAPFYSVWRSVEAMANIYDVNKTTHSKQRRTT